MFPALSYKRSQPIRIENLDHVVPVKHVGCVSHGGIHLRNNSGLIIRKCGTFTDKNMVDLAKQAFSTNNFDLAAEIYEEVYERFGSKRGDLLGIS